MRKFYGGVDQDGRLAVYSIYIGIALSACNSRLSV